VLSLKPALEALKGHTIVKELAIAYGVHPAQVTPRKSSIVAPR